VVYLSMQRVYGIGEKPQWIGLDGLVWFGQDSRDSRYPMLAYMSGA